MSTTSTNDEGVRTITVGGDESGVDITVIEAGEDGPFRIELTGFGDTVIEDGGVRMGRDLAAQVAAELFQLLTG